MPSRQVTYPFSAIVGQEKLKLALILNAINPRIGGLLISGANGTGKSLAVKAFEDVLPEVDAVEGCPFNCNPKNVEDLCARCSTRFHKDGSLPTTKRRIRLVHLPISVTEDRLIGALDVQAALIEGRKILLPGLLAEANQNILYIDEVNLLPDYLVNSFLDPIASGWNVVQREGVSLAHPSRFILIASMNPEEGELRPQILDRFALHVQTENIRDVKQRIEIAQRNSTFEQDPIAFCKKFKDAQEDLRSRIAKARGQLPKTTIPDQIFHGIADTFPELNLDGCRSDIAALRAARALAAFKGRNIVEPEDILEVSDLALSHRMRKLSYADSADKPGIIDHLKESLSKEAPLPPKETKVEKQTAEDIKKLLESPLPDYKPKHRRRRKVSSVLKVIYPAVLFLMIFLLYSILLFLGSSIYLFFIGGSNEILAETLSLSRLWPYIALMAMLTLLIPFLLSPFVGRRKDEVPVYVYRTSRGKIGSKIVQRIHQPNMPPKMKLLTEKEEIKSDTKSLNIPLYATLGRFYKMILSRGPKIAGSLKQFRGRDKKLKFSLAPRLSKRKGSLMGRRVKTISSLRQGRYVSFEFPKRKPWDIALSPTIRAAAPYQPQRKSERVRIVVNQRDIRVKMRETQTSLTILLLLDASESMTSSLNNIRKAVLSMHDIAYKKRDRVALVVFKGSTSSVLQPPTTNLSIVEKKLLEVGTSDFTPLASGMLQAWKVLRNEKMRNKNIIPALVIVTDGIANIPLERPLSPFTRAKLLNPAQADVLDVAGLLRREEIRTIIINTAHDISQNENMPLYENMITERTNRRWMKPTNLLLEILRITGGYYYGIGEGGQVESTVLMDAFTVMDQEPQRF